MGQSFKTYRDRILLSEMLGEIFDSKPFQNQFKFSGELGKNIMVNEFYDPKGNIIDIYFNCINSKSNLYELDFMVNKSSFDNPNLEYSIKDYTQLLSTVAEATTQFLKSYSPTGLLIKGNNIFRKIDKNPSAEGQKDRIYNFFISQIEDKGKYMVDKSHPEGIALMRK